MLTSATRGEMLTPNPNECNSTLTSATRGEMLTPNPNECNSTLSSVTGGTYPHPDTYIYKCSLVVWNLGSPCNLRAEDTHICTVSSTSFPGLY